MYACVSRAILAMKLSNYSHVFLRYGLDNILNMTNVNQYSTMSVFLKFLLFIYMKYFNIINVAWKAHARAMNENARTWLMI